MSSMVGNGYSFLCATRFKSFASKQIRRFPFSFNTITIEFTNFVGSLTGQMMSFLTSSSNSSLNLSRSGTGTRRGACCTGFAFESTLMTCSPSMQPGPSEKTCGKSATTCSSARQVLPTMKTVPLPIQPWFAHFIIV